MDSLQESLGSRSVGGSHLSLVMPCFNEQEIVGFTIRRLVAAFQRAGYVFELVAVDNGSTDRTGEILQELAAELPGIVVHRMARQEGFGDAVRAGLPLTTASWVGVIGADGEVDGENVVQLYETVAGSTGPVLAKVRRRFRADGALRKIVSVGYNLLVMALWPRLGSLDVNGTPKITRRETLTAMRLQSRNWLIDPEIMIKAQRMNVRVLEFSVFARMRGDGLAHVRLATCWEFLRYLLRMRFSRELAIWERGLGHPVKSAEAILPVSDRSFVHTVPR
jgi:glycosyltransferase involved in cell wall biosynthesis